MFFILCSHISSLVSVFDQRKREKIGVAFQSLFWSSEFLQFLFIWLVSWGLQKYELHFQPLPSPYSSGCMFVMQVLLKQRWKHFISPLTFPLHGLFLSTSEVSPYSFAYNPCFSFFFSSRFFSFFFFFILPLFVFTPLMIIVLPLPVV